MARDKEQLFQVSLGENASLDVIKLEDMSVLFVISERGSIQRRTVATLDANEAIRMAKFIVGIKEIGDE